MSLLALVPILYLISSSVRQYLSKSWEEMDRREKERIGDFVLDRLSALYGMGRAPRVRREGSRECKEMKIIIESEVKTKEGRRRMKRAVDWIMREYAEQIEREGFAFPPYPVGKKKKKRRKIELVVE